MAEPPYQIVIGLEVHVRLLTATKLFCGCDTRFGLPPNTATCPVCMGLPGALPVMNRRAFDLALKAALALNCTIATFTKWDRKNYYYPDLPKNYQISQYDFPFSRDGWLDIDAGAGRQRVRIVRVHLEEDAGKMLHDETGGGAGSLVDLNRTGTPLLEIVSQPDLHAPEAAKAYLEEIRQLLRELEVSDCEMQEGSLRCDANINLHIPIPDGGIVATPIVEVKNMNSFRAVERAMKYEAERQFADFECTGQKLGEVSKVTAGWNDAQGITVVRRRKEEVSDYRFFPEPDLAPVEVSSECLDSIRNSLGALPAAERQRLEKRYGLSGYDATVVVAQGKAFVQYLEEVIAQSGDAKVAVNWVTNQVLRTLNESKVGIGDFPISAHDLANLIKHIKEIGLNNQRSLEVFGHMAKTGTSAERAIEDLGIKVMGDESELVEIIRRAVAANPKAVADFKKGKIKAADAIKGAVMRETKGMAKTDSIQKLLMRELEEAE